MRSGFEEIKQAIENSQNVLLTTHERTDGDDLGSVLALWHEIQRQGKYAHISVTGGVPDKLRFLPGTEKVTEHLPHENFDLIIVSGCSHKGRIGHERIANLGAPTINIDHHPDNSLYGDINLVDASKSSVAELVFDLFKHNNYKLTSHVAQCLLTGIFTDTGSFMHSNTKTSTLKASSELMRYGARISKIAKNTYAGKDIQTMHAWGKALEKTYFSEQNNFIYSVITQKDMEDLGYPSADTFEGFVEMLNKVPEAKFAMFLKQEGDTVKGSLRSDPHKNVDVGSIARSLGGGGHMWAAGFSFRGQLDQDNKGKWEIKKSAS